MAEPMMEAVELEQSPKRVYINNLDSYSSKYIAQTKAQVDEVVAVMEVNMHKLLERDQKLCDLVDRTDALQAGAAQFKTSAIKVKRNCRWKNRKVWAILIGFILVIIIIIIIISEVYK